MEPEKSAQIGICYKCSVDNMDSSLKRVYLCDMCDKWFCELHQKPKFPYFDDYDNFFDVQGDPRVKASFHYEHNRKDGHPDLVYFRRTIEALDLEKKTNDELIKQAMDRMMRPEKYDIEPQSRIETDEEKSKRVEMLKKEESELIRLDKRQETLTTENHWGYKFVVPIEVYSNAEDREYLNLAKTMKSVKVIVIEYYKKHKKKKRWLY